ncbi:hypothetical protein WCP94_003377 [Bilophila wadsworthia]
MLSDAAFACGIRYDIKICFPNQKNTKAIVIFFNSLYMILKIIKINSCFL